MLSLYICTFNQKILAVGAAKNLKNNILDKEYKIILLCGIGCKDIMNDPIYDEVIETPALNSSNRRKGWIAAYIHSIEKKNELSVCIDDDIRLTSPTSIASRYTKDRYVPENTFCVQIWKNPYQNYYNHLKVVRLYYESQCVGWDKELSKLAINNFSERIDDIWLHIDKGSEKMTKNRQDLINYIDRG